MPYIEKILTLTDIEDILSLQKKVVETLENPDSFHPDTREEIETYLTKAFGVGIYDQDKMIAYQLVKEPTPEESLLRHLPEYVPKNLRTLHSETSAVHPDYRGQGLQQRVKEMMREIIKNENGTDIVCNTIHPLNYPSLKNSLKAGAKVARIGEFYGGKTRCILFHLVSEKLSFDYDREALTMPLHNYMEISKILKKGYVGHAFKEGSILLSRIRKVLTIDTGDNTNV